MKILVFLISATLCAGCAAAQKQDPPGAKQRRPASSQARPVPHKAESMPRMSPSRRLSKAIELLEQGEVQGAAKMLNTIVSAKGVPGVTDEALFRLALLTLKPSQERPVSRQGYQLLRRLKDEYPASPWTVQAAPLMELINVDEELRQQNKNLKASNQALTKKITELNQSLEQLKHLDLELEEKTR